MNNTRGGYRIGAGRKKSEEGQRPRHQIRAYANELELIKEYIKIVRECPERAKRILETE